MRATDTTGVRLGITYGLWTIGVALGLYLLSLHRYLLFHCIAEGFSLLVAFGMFLVAWHTRKYSENGFLLFLGIAFIAVFCMDFLHTIAYEGMGVFTGDTVDSATQLWVSARIVQSVSLLVAPYYLTHRFKPLLPVTVYLAITILFIDAIFWLRCFPSCFDPNHGQTIFKRTMEYMIMIILGGAYFNFRSNRERIDHNTFHFIVASIVFSILSEASFTFYHDPYSFANLLGHLLKIVAFYLIYKAIIASTLEKPFDTLFSSLKKTNERLYTSEEHYRRMFDLSGVAKAEADPVSGRFTRVNRHFCSITGYEEDELMKLTYADLTHPDDREEDRRNLTKVLCGERSFWNTEKRYLRKDGTEIWVSVFGTLLQDTDGSPLHTIADVIDITDRKEADRKIASVAKFPEENPFPVMRFDRNGTVLYANKPAVAMLDGWGCSIDEGLKEADCPQLLKVLPVNEQSVVEIQYNQRWYSLVVVPVSGLEYVNVYGRDITDEKSYREALVISERRYALAQRTANIGTWEWHIPSGTMHWSEQVEPMFGMPSGSFGGTYQAFLERVYPEDRHRIADAVETCIRNGLDYRVEHRIVRPDGMVQWILESAMLLYNAADTPERMIGVVIDITRQYEERLALEATVATQATVLADTKETLELVSEQKMEAEKELRQRHKALEAVYTILTSSETSLQEIGDRVVENIATILDLQAVSFYHVTDGTIPLFVHYTDGKLSHESKKPGLCSACESAVMHNTSSQYTGDLSVIFPDSSCFEKSGFRSYITVPVLTYQSEMVGVLCAMRRKEQAFQDHEVHLIEIFARYIAYEIVRRNMQQRMLQSQEMHLLGQLTSGVAHEVRNPLNALMAISEAMFKRIDDQVTYG